MGLQIFEAGLKANPRIRVAMATRSLLFGAGPSPRVVALVQLVAPRSDLILGGLWERTRQIGLGIDKASVHHTFYRHTYRFVRNSLEFASLEFVKLG